MDQPAWENVSAKGIKSGFYCKESGAICPDPYAHFWENAIYYGDGFQSVEIEIPCTALYMTPQDRWTDKWVLNIDRAHLPYKCRLGLFEEGLC